MRDMTIGLPVSVQDKRTTTARNAELKKACKEFESIFTYQLLKSMRGSIEKCDLFHGGQGEEIYESLLDQEYAKQMAGSGSGSLADILYQQFTRDNTVADAPSSLASSSNKNEHSARPSWPVNSNVSSRYGWRKDPFTGEMKFHQGIDMPAQEGYPIITTLPGRVIYSDRKSGYGNLVVIDHGHGITSLYAHNKENIVTTGTWVEKGAPIARVGSSGRSTGPHLHFEVRRHGRQVDPLSFLGS